MTKIKLKKGLACLTEERRKEIAAMGGRAAHACGKAYKYNSKTGSLAGKKSVESRKKKRELI